MILILVNILMEEVSIDMCGGRWEQGQQQNFKSEHFFMYPLVCCEEIVVEIIVVVVVVTLDIDIVVILDMIAIGVLVV